MVSDEPIDSVAATIHVGARPGLLIEDGSPAPPLAVRSPYLDGHAQGSVRNRSGILEIAEDPMFEDHEGIGLSLEFDRGDIPIRRGWYGPTEAVVDDLSPWLGRYTSRMLVADHRIRDVRFVRGVDPSRSGVRIAIWYVPDESISVPPDVIAKIALAS